MDRSMNAYDDGIVVFTIRSARYARRALAVVVFALIILS
jgi:hypothetical protein